MLTPFSAAQNIRIGVLGLFHPRELRLAPIDGSALVVHVDEQSIILEKSSGEGAATFNIERNLIVIATKTRTLRATSLLVTSRENGASSFVLTVPDKITRRYYGILELKPDSGKLTAVVSMDLETAVASVVGAESMPLKPRLSPRVLIMPLEKDVITDSTSVTPRTANFYASHRLLRVRWHKPCQRRVVWCWPINLIPLQLCTLAVAAGIQKLPKI